MKFVIAPDSFKESMTAKAAAVAIQAGLQKIFPDAEYELVPMADGGEGTVQSLVDATEGEIITADVQSPLNETVSAFYGVLGDQNRLLIKSVFFIIPKTLKISFIIFLTFLRVHRTLRYSISISQYLVMIF